MERLKELLNYTMEHQYTLDMETINTEANIYLKSTHDIVSNIENKQYKVLPDGKYEVGTDDGISIFVDGGDFVKGNILTAFKKSSGDGIAYAVKDPSLQSPYGLAKKQLPLTVYHNLQLMQNH